jgi:hypothetical protein
VVVGRTACRDIGARAQHCVGAGSLLCSNHCLELEICLHNSYCFLGADHSVFDCRGVALCEDQLNLGALLSELKLRPPKRETQDKSAGLKTRHYTVKRLG